MEIKCPKCKEALELPNEAIGAKVQCPFCAEKFTGEAVVLLKPSPTVSVRQKLREIVSRLNLTPDQQQQIGWIEQHVAKCFKRENVKVHLSDVLAGHGNVILIFTVDEGCSHAKAEKMLRECVEHSDVCRSWGCLPGKQGIAVEYTIRSFECEPINEFLKRQAWNSAVNQVGSVPFPLGIDIAGRDIVLDLSKFSVLSLVRSDQPLSDEFLIPRLAALYSARPEVEYHYIGCGSRRDLPGPAGRNLGMDEEMPFGSEPENSNGVIAWCDKILKTISHIEGELENRTRLLNSVGAEDIGEYNRSASRKLNPIIVVAINLPEPEKWMKLDWSVHVKANEVFDKLRSLVEMGKCKKYGITVIGMHRLGEHGSMANLINGVLDPYKSGTSTGIVMHWGNYSWAEGTEWSRNGFCGPEATRVISGRFFVYRSPENEVYGIYNFLECNG